MYLECRPDFGVKPCSAGGRRNGLPSDSARARRGYCLAGLPRAAQRATILVISTAFLAMAGCAGRPGPEVLRETAAAVPGTRMVTVYVATTRQREIAGTNIFSSGRTQQMNYAATTISIPSRHKPGEIEWPKGRPNPQTDFVTAEQRALEKPAFEREVSRRRGASRPNIAVFVHGYNTNFPEGLFRLAQLTNDAAFDGVPILFAWPSEGTLEGYISDKDAVTFSRDGLVQLLATLAESPAIGDITVVGHSMGGWLTAEALRQLRLTGKDAVIKRLYVVLSAPDIDVDVFLAQMAVIGPLSPPLVILVSRDDMALSISERLSGEHRRLGALDVYDPRVIDAARKANVQVIDISNLKTPDIFKHSRFIALATAAGAPNARSAPRQAGTFVYDALGTSLSSSFLFAAKAIGRD
jgi:esterase/lipase superfamily enzyme